MSNQEFDSGTMPSAETPADSEQDQLESLARLERLEAENEQLRAEYARARRSQYRRTAVALAAVGTIAVIGGLLFPASREVLIAIGATGVFGGLLTYFLTPEQFVPATVGEQVYATGATNIEAIATDLELQDESVYLPPTSPTAARLYIPEPAEYDLPAADAGPFVTEANSRGLVLETTGSRLFEEFEQAVAGDLTTTPEPLARQLSDGVVEQFELAKQATPDVDPEDGRITFAVTESAFGAVDRIDHPIASFFAVAIAATLETPVTLEVTEETTESDGWLITCRFD